MNTTALVIAFVFYLMLTASAVSFYFISSLLPAYGAFFIVAALLAINGAGFILFWSLTTEGSVWIARRLGRKNLGIDIFWEKGSFARFIPVMVSGLDVQIKGAYYKLRNNAMFYRSGGTPYIIHKEGDAEPILLEEREHVSDASENTQYFRNVETLIEYMMRSQQYRLLLIVSLLAIGITIIAALFIYFVGIDPVSQKADIISNQVAAVGKMLVSPTPTAIAGAIPNA